MDINESINIGDLNLTVLIRAAIFCLNDFLDESKKKLFRDYFVITYKNQIKYWANVYDIPPELIAGVIYNECPRVSDDFDQENIDKLSELLYYLGIKSTDATLGPIQASEKNVRKELLNLSNNDEKFLIENLSREELKALLYQPTFCIRYVAMVLAKVKRHKYPKKTQNALTENDMAMIIKNWNKNERGLFSRSYSDAFKIMLPHIRKMIK